MTVMATFASLTLLFAMAIGIAFHWLTRLPKCPRCGGKNWVANPHLGPFAAYCRDCLHQVDMSNWKGKA